MNARAIWMGKRRWWAQLGFSIALGALFLVALLWGIQGVTPVRADPGDLYVDGASGQDISTCGTVDAPCQTISYTLNSRASDGDTILIAAGTYTENLTISGMTLTLRGGYNISGTLWLPSSGETIIDGDHADRVFLIHGNNSVLENLTITGGQASGGQCWGGGVWVTNGDVTIRSSKITGNAADCGGAGIELNDDFGAAHLTLESSTLSYNTGGHNGGLLVFGGNGSAVINNSQIFSNTASWAGGGIATTNGATLSISNSSVMYNSAPDGQSGGIDVGGGSTVTVMNSVIADNSTRDHGAAATIDLGATLNLTNTLITGNSTTSGAANVFAVNGDVTIMNSTISDNNPQGGAVILWSGHLTVTNSILWNNSLNLQGDPPCPTCFTVTYSDIQGGWPGVGNIDADPQFADPSDGDYHLFPWSPCIDSGTATGAPDHDLDGVTRPQNAGYDMGAYEFVGTPVQNEGTRYVAVSGSNDGPNLCLDPAAPCATVGHAAGMANAGESVWIAGGTYTENLNVSKPLTLTGGYAPGTAWLPGGEAILDGSGAPTILGDWDGVHVQKPAVISDSGAYKMWFDGGNLLTEVQIGLATSSGGLSWTKSAANPVLTGTWGAWNEPQGEHAPFVLKESGVYKMWYEGTNEHMVRQLGYATSTNGVDWHAYAGNPVLAAGPEPYDQETAGHGTVLNDGGAYKLWYHAMGDQGPIIAYATSADGVNWTKQGPVLLPQGGSWDEEAVWGPSVLKLDGVYWMWHAGVGPQQPAIGVVTSTDGVNWTRFHAGPVISAPTRLGDPHVISDSGVLKMWYQDFDQGAILYAESDDGVNWNPSPDPVLTPGEPGQWGGPVVYFRDGSAGSVLENLTIQGGSDEAAGGVHAASADVTIRNCVIRDNFANGVPHSDAGGGVLGGVAGDGHVTIVDTKIISNRVNQGASGVRVHEGSLTMINTLVAGNRGAEGVHLNGAASLMNVTIAGNGVAVNRPGINYNPPSGARLMMINAILYGNGDSIHVPDPALVQVSYSDVEGGWFGTGNIDADPQFANPAGGDYHLQGSSRAIDAGTPFGAPPADLDGTPRDARPDMGAYEYQRLDHDVAVVDVLPGGSVAVNVSFSIRATLYNVGNSTEDNVPVTCEIVHGGSNVYTQTINSSQIQPLTWQVLQFPSYTPTSQGLYTLTCQSNLSNDERQMNDTYTQTLTVLEEIADVWTKDNPDDDGDVPSALDRWYESPDLWVRNSDDGGLIHQDPIVGVTNTVYVRLRNRGTVAISGTVDVYWIEPSLGVRCGDWAYIDTIPFANLLPGEVRIVSTPWIPTRTGHTCLQDVIDSPQDPYNRALECAPQWVPWDNNVEWHNVNVIANPRNAIMGVRDVKEAEVQLVNVYNLPQEVDLIIERKTFPITGAITVQLPAGLFDRWWVYGGRWSEGVEVVTATREISVTGAVSATIGAIPMQAAEKAAVGLTLDGPAGLTFEMAIRERIDGVTIGGVGYQWTIPDKTPPSVTDKSPAERATDVALDAPVVVAFDEEIAPLNFSLTLTPTLGVTITWNEAGTVVTATHAGFAAETTYTATVTASDAVVNGMTPEHWTFTTKAEGHKIYLPLVLRNS